MFEVGQVLSTVACKIACAVSKYRWARWSRIRAICRHGIDSCVTANRFQTDGPADHVTGQPAFGGTVSGAPGMAASRGRGPAGRHLRRLLHHRAAPGGWLVPALILLPDLAWAGYLRGTRVGAITYNSAHATPLPAVMIGLGWWQHRPLVLALGLVWLAHIGLDRLQGYGLKYGNSFQYTHLGILGRRKEAS